MGRATALTFGRPAETGDSSQWQDSRRAFRELELALAKARVAKGLCPEKVRALAAAKLELLTRRSG
jgi:hypothetical protein